jgi:hypothetical protein
MRREFITEKNAIQVVETWTIHYADSFIDGTVLTAKLSRNREKQKIFTERHKDTLAACHAAMEGNWNEAAKLFFKGTDDPTNATMVCWICSAVEF